MTSLRVSAEEARDQREAVNRRVESELDGLAARCRWLATLPAGWLDGDGAAVDRGCAERAYRWLAPLVEDGTLPRGASVYPRPDGSVQAEWDPREGWYAELVFHLNGSVEASMTDPRYCTRTTLLHPHDAWSAARGIRAFLGEWLSTGDHR